MTKYRIHPEAPVDDEGHPIHPERGHRICARAKSDRTTPTKHGRERDDVPYCTLAAGWGVEDSTSGACDHHGGNAGAPEGDDNGAYEHGAYTEHIIDDLTEREREAFDAMVRQLHDGEDDGQRDLLREQAVEAYLKYKRSGDDRFLREYRQLLSEFNIVDATDRQEVEHTGEVTGDFSVNITHHRVTEEDTDE